MRRTLRSSARFQKGLCTLFEKLEGRETELQQRIDEVIGSLTAGDLTRIRRHHEFDTTACIPLVDDYVVVVQLSGSPGAEDFIDLLTVGREPR